MDLSMKLKTAASLEFAISVLMKCALSLSRWVSRENRWNPRQKCLQYLLWHLLLTWRKESLWLGRLRLVDSSACAVAKM